MVKYITAGKVGRPVLPAHEQAALVALAQTGDREARARLVEHNMGFIVNCSVSKKKNLQIDSDEQINIGVLGYLKALDKFDASKGYKFNTFAEQYIKNELQIARGQSRFGREYSGNEEAERSMVFKAEEHCWIAYGHRGTDRQVAEAMGTTATQAYEDRLRMVQKHRGEGMSMPESMDMPREFFGHSDTYNKHDTVASPMSDPAAILSDRDDRQERWERAAPLAQEFLDMLNDNQREVVQRRFGLPPYDFSPDAAALSDGQKRGATEGGDPELLDLQVIAKQMNMPERSVSATLMSAMKNLRKAAHVQA